jgi:hypothetical protein
MANSGLDGIDILLIDGNNLLHRIAGTAEAAAQRTLLARLRAAIPDTIATVLVLDGHAYAGSAGRQRVREGFEIQHSGSMSGDDALLKLIGDTPPNERVAMTLVSDDIALANRARMLGARTKRLVWLEELIEAPQAKRVSIGAGRPAGQPAVWDSPIDEERPAWQPGRGATRKIGNPKRGRSGARRAKGLR